VSAKRESRVIMKRKYVSKGGYSARKRAAGRRSYRRKRPSRAARSSYMSSQKGGYLSTYLAKRGPRMSGRAYRNMLWKSTIQKEHYRSIYDETVPLTTSVNPLLKSVSIVTMYHENFYLAAGGATTTQTFNGDIVIRGGLCKLRVFHNHSVTVNVEVTKVFLKDKNPVIAATVPLAWDPTCLVDFQEFYSIGETKAFDIEPGDHATVVHRLGVNKIDQSLSTALQRQPAWLITVRNPSGTALSIPFTVGHNMSFSGDVDT